MQERTRAPNARRRCFQIFSGMIELKIERGFYHRRNHSGWERMRLRDQPNSSKSRGKVSKSLIRVSKSLIRISKSLALFSSKNPK